MKKLPKLTFKHILIALVVVQIIMCAIMLDMSGKINSLRTALVISGGSSAGQLSPQNDEISVGLRAVSSELSSIQRTLGRIDNDLMRK